MAGEAGDWVPPVPAECVALTAEGLRLEEQAAELDAAASWVEAAKKHHRAAAKLAEAVQQCPESHPDRPTLQTLVSEVTARAVYLESLNGATATMPLEEHVGPAALVMDLSSAPSPEEQQERQELQQQEDVSELLRKSGTSGASSPLTQEGFLLVRALRSGGEMRAFLLRLIQGGGRKLRVGAEEELERFAAPESADGAQALENLAEVQDKLRQAPWIELDVDVNEKDKLQLGVKLEKEAKAMEGQGRKEDAAQMFGRSIAAFQYVLKFDDRALRSEKVKEGVVKKIEELEARAQALR